MTEHVDIENHFIHRMIQQSKISVVQIDTEEKDTV